MSNRCQFLDNFPAYNYNHGVGVYDENKQRTDTHELGSSLMEAMLKEVSEFCDPEVKKNWSHYPHQQVIIGLWFTACLYAADPTHLSVDL